MTTTSPALTAVASRAPYGSVVVGVDPLTCCAALLWAALEATRRGRSLHLLHGYAGPRGPAHVAGRDQDTLKASPERVLQAAVASVRRVVPSLRITTELREGPAAESLTAASRTADTVVLGAHGRGALAAAVLGSVSVHVAVHARCPVVVVKNGEDPERPRDTVVVGVAASQDSQACLAYAFEQAASRGTTLEVVHAWSSRVSATYQMEQRGSLLLAEALAGWAGRYPDVEVRRSVVEDEPVSALVRHADGAELLVVGSRGRGGVRGLLLGSVSRGVLNRAGGPVAVVRPNDDTDLGDSTPQS